MDKLFQSKWFIRIISLVLAVTLYLFVTVETNTATNESRIPSTTPTEVKVLDDVPLDIKIDAEQYVVSGVPEEVSVSLEGKTSVLTPTVMQRNFSVFVDLRDLTEGEHVVEIEHENIPKDLTAYIEPKTIEVSIEKRTSREFSVDVDIVNADKLPVGYELGQATIDPETVTIVSSESIIEQIAMVKVFVDVRDLKESIENKEVPISVYDIQGHDLKVNVEPQSVTVSLPVERPSKKVPLEVVTKGDLPKGLEIDEIEAPEEIEIFGKREILNGIDHISTEAIDLKDVEKSGEVDIPLAFPEGVIANDKELKVHISLLQSKKIEDKKIDVEGLGDRDVTFVDPSTDKATITAIGPDALMEKLKDKDIEAYIDITNRAVGKHEIEVKLRGPDDIALEAEQSKIFIEIEESE